MGSSLQEVASSRPGPVDDGRGRRPRTSFADPREVDAVPDGLCRFCGLPGPHLSRAECIDALRDKLARHEFYAGYRQRKRRVDLSDSSKFAEA